jgi:threonine dehydrogenase-like Zn-dependent dehydrogenase
VPAKVVDEHAVFTEPLSAACGILERVSIDKSDRVAVIGDGKLGLLCAQVVALTGAQSLLVGKHADKLQIVERRGVETSTPKQRRNRQFDVVVEASGAAPGFTLSIYCDRKAVLSQIDLHAPPKLMARIVVDEISIVGSRCDGSSPPSIYSKGAINVDDLISEEYQLSQGVHAMRRAGTKGVLKVLLRP